MTDRPDEQPMPYPEWIRLRAGVDRPDITPGVAYHVLARTDSGLVAILDDAKDTHYILRDDWEPAAPPAPTSGAIAGALLAEAAEIVGGARNATHGDKERSFVAIAGLWNAYLDGRKAPGPISPRDVAACMVLLKLARSVQGTPDRDHFLDAAGYAAIAGELAACE